MAREPPGADIGHLVNRGQGEHRATGFVEIAGGDIDDLDQPLIEGAIGRDGNTHPAIADTGLRSSQISGDVFNSRRRNAGMGCSKSRREIGNSLGNSVQASGECRQRTGICQLLSKNSIEHSQQQQDVCAGLNEVVLAGKFGGFGAPGVDQHQLATATGERFDAFANIRHGPDAAVGGQWVGSQHEKVIRAIDIGNREQRFMTEQPQ